MAEEYVAPAYFTQQDVERRFGETALVQLCDDDRNGEADADVVNQLVEEASAAADALLYAAFGAAVVVKVVKDARARSAMTDIFMSLAGQRRHEFQRPDGSWPYSNLWKRGETILMNVGKGIERLGAEGVYGENPTLTGRTSRALPATHIFAPSRTRPGGSGGF